MNSNDWGVPEAAVFYFRTHPLHMCLAAAIGIVGTLIFRWLSRRSQVGMKHPIMLVIVSALAAAPLFMVGVLSVIMAEFCFLGGPGWKVGSRDTIIAGSIIALVGIASLLVGLSNVSVALKTRRRFSQPSPSQR
jgi:hypothetical protein